MQSPSIAPPDLDTRASVSRLAWRYASQFDSYMPSQAASASPPLDYPSGESFSQGFDPQTPTLSAPDTPTTAGPTSPGPLTPSTPFFGPPSPGYAYNKDAEALDIPVPPKALLSEGATKFTAQRVGASGDLRSVLSEEEDEGQEIVIPEPRAGLVSPLRLHFSPPRPLATSANRLKVQESYTSLGSAYTASKLHHQDSDPHEADFANAYKSNVLSASTTAVDDSFESGIFEMLTPTQENRTFLVEPALPEMTSSVFLPFPADASSPQSVSSPVNETRTMNTGSDKPPSNSSKRPFVLRRHRPPPISVSQDLNSIVRRFHALQIFLRYRDGPPANVPTPEPVLETPPRGNISGSAGSRNSSNKSISNSPSTSFPSAPTESWFPPSGPDSPVRLVTDSPAPMTPSPPPLGGFIRRHRPRSVRSISPVNIGESVMSGHTLGSPDSGIEGMHDESGRASQLFFPLPPSRGHRRQFAVSVSFPAVEDSVVSLDAARNSRSLSPNARRYIEGPQAEYRRRERLPDWATRPEIVVSGPGSISKIDASSGGEAVRPPKKPKGFWKALSTSASGLFVRKDKTPSNQLQDADFEASAPKKRILASISGLFRRSEGGVTRPSPPTIRQVAHAEVWPPIHRRTSSCSDSTCLYHPRHPTSSLAAMSFATTPAPGVGYDLGDAERSFLPELGTWELDATPPTSGFYTSESESGSPDPSVGGTTSSVIGEGERVLNGIIRISEGERARRRGSS